MTADLGIIPEHHKVWSPNPASHPNREALFWRVPFCSSSLLKVDPAWHCSVPLFVSFTFNPSLSLGIFSSLSSECILLLGMPLFHSSRLALCLLCHQFHSLASVPHYNRGSISLDYSPSTSNPAWVCSEDAPFSPNPSHILMAPMWAQRHWAFHTCSFRL